MIGSREEVPTEDLAATDLIADGGCLELALLNDFVRRVEYGNDNLVGLRLCDVARLSHHDHAFEDLIDTPIRLNSNDRTSLDNVALSE